MKSVPDPELREEYRFRVKRFLKVRKRPGLFLFYVFHLAMHFHAYTMTKNMTTGRREIVNSY